MNELKGDVGELKMIVEVTRKATGKVETYELSALITAEAATELGLKDDDGVAHSLDGIQRRSD